MNAMPLMPNTGTLLLQTALQMLAAPAALLTPQGEFIDANTPLVTLLGLPGAATLQGHSLLQHIDHSWRSTLAQQLQSLRDDGSPQIWDNTLHCADGEARTLQMHARRIKEADLICLVLFDVTEYRHDEAVLRKTLLEQQAILENAAVGILFTRDSTILECNIRAAEMFGYTRRQLLGQKSLMIFADQSSFQALSVQASPPLTAGDSFQIEWQLRRNNGELFWCRLYARAIDPWHTGQGTIWIAEDIDAHKRDEQKLRHTLLEMEAIMANAPLAIGFHRDNHILRYNQHYGAMFGFDGRSGEGCSSCALYPTQNAFEQAGSIVLPQLHNHGSFQGDMEMRRQDGSLFWAHAIAYVINPEQPEQGTVWIFDDRSEQKQAEEAKKHLLLEQQAILDNASVGIMFTRAHQIQRCNPRLAQIFGLPQEDLTGLAAAQIFLGDAYALLRREAQALLGSGQAFEKPEIELQRADGSRFWASIRCKAVDPEHSEEGTIWIVQDVTSERQDAQQMRHTLMELDAIMSTDLDPADWLCAEPGRSDPGHNLDSGRPH